MMGQRRGDGLNGTYLFELGAQRAGPEGWLATTAGSEPKTKLSLPQGVRSRCPPRLEIAKGRFPNSHRTEDWDR